MFHHHLQQQQQQEEEEGGGLFLVEEAAEAADQQQESSMSNLTSSASTVPPPPPPSSGNNGNNSNKRKRSLPGNPDPEAEVVALSPATLMATNRFVCEICGKGFQRDQNLQLHRRGHNLPWKLKQRGSKEAVRKKVYICPEASCVHHDPSRALGDLTGIKKHFFRKHGEKKWKCDKCSKKYAVHSDWKAHSKICGTREYKCDCGTIFSRSFFFLPPPPSCLLPSIHGDRLQHLHSYCLLLRYTCLGWLAVLLSHCHFASNPVFSLPPALSVGTVTSRNRSSL
jgi:DNA-directed RNA polymerase subunit RPC12/RpoP